MSKLIHKKTWSSVFSKIVSGEKTFDVRLADWQCEPGDILVLDEVDDETKQPTGRSIHKVVGFVLKTKDMPFFSKKDVDAHGLQVISLLEQDSSRTYVNLLEQALDVRDHYNELQLADGHKLWYVHDRMAGFVGDVGDLSKLIMAKNNTRRGPKDLDAALEHELSDCLWSIMVIADELGIDLEAAFVKNMAQLHSRIEKEKAEA